MPINQFYTAAIAGAKGANELAKFGIQSAKALKSQVGPKSLTRVSKESIFQFPVIVSGDIETDDIAVLAKAFEKNYASLMVSWMSLEGDYDRNQYDSVGDFLKKFHTNTVTSDEIANNFILEAFNVSDKEVNSISLDQDLISSLWDIAEEQVDMESLNDIYQPYARTKRVLEQTLSAMHGDIALEADGEPNPTNEFYTKHPTLQKIKNNINDNKAESFDDFVIDTAKDHLDKQKKAGPNDPIHKRSAFTVADLKGRPNAIIEDRSVANLAPTMINVSLNGYDTSNGSNVMWTKNVVLGIKAMVRICKSNILIANMVEACKGSYGIFGFIKWTKGELKLHDIIFGTSKWKSMALPSTSNRWLNSLKKRKTLNTVLKFVPGSKKLLPNTTIVITEGEASMIAEQCGIDLHEISHVKKIIDKYLLLGFGIYDNQTKILNMFYDGDTEYSVSSLRQLVALVRKDTNILTDTH